jgi:hypothetical protein
MAFVEGLHIDDLFAGADRHSLRVVDVALDRSGFGDVEPLLVEGESEGAVELANQDFAVFAAVGEYVDFAVALNAVGDQDFLGWSEQHHAGPLEIGRKFFEFESFGHDESGSVRAWDDLGRIADGLGGEWGRQHWFVIRAVDGENRRSRQDGGHQPDDGLIGYSHVRQDLVSTLGR